MRWPARSYYTGNKTPDIVEFPWYTFRIEIRDGRALPRKVR